MWGWWLHGLCRLFGVVLCGMVRVLFWRVFGLVLSMWLRRVLRRVWRPVLRSVLRPVLRTVLRAVLRVVVGAVVGGGGVMAGGMVLGTGVRGGSRRVWVAGAWLRTTWGSASPCVLCLLSRLLSAAVSSCVACCPLFSVRRPPT